MNETETKNQLETVDIRRLACAIRFAFAILFLFFSTLSIRSSLSIENFHRMFMDMLGGHKLPPVTAFVIGNQLFFIAISFATPVVIIASCFLKNLVRSFYILGVMAFISMVQLAVTYEACSAPIMQILKEMEDVSAR